MNLLTYLYFGEVHHPGTYMKFSLITIYGSNVPSKPLYLTYASNIIIITSSFLVN